jgi:hypothetical protein
VLVELLIGIGLPVIKIGFVVAIAEVLAKSQILIKIIKNTLQTSIVFEREFAHAKLVVNSIKMHNELFAKGEV